MTREDWSLLRLVGAVLVFLSCLMLWIVKAVWTQAIGSRRRT